MIAETLENKLAGEQIDEEQLDEFFGRFGSAGKMKKAIAGQQASFEQPVQGKSKLSIPGSVNTILARAPVAKGLEALAGEIGKQQAATQVKIAAEILVRLGLSAEFLTKNLSMLKTQTTKAKPKAAGPEADAARSARKLSLESKKDNNIEEVIAKIIQEEMQNFNIK